MRERGTAAIELVLGVGAILVPATLLVLSLGPLLQQRNLVREAAAEAARAYVLSEGDAEVVTAVAARAIDGAFRIGMCSDAVPPQRAVDACDIARSGSIEVTVEVDARLAFVPGPTLVVSWRHREPVDPYRSLP